MLLVWAPGWYLTYNYWPTGVDSHIFESSLYFVPAKTAAERLAHELAAVTFKEYALQDANTLEATQRMLKSRVITEFPLCDQELLLRALHQTGRDYVKEYTDGRLPAEFADLEPFSGWILETERERYAKRLATPMEEMQAFYDAAFPRLAEANKYLEDYPLGGRPSPSRSATCCCS